MTEADRERVAIVAAMPSEMRPLAKAAGLVRGRVGGVDVWTGRIGDHDVLAALVGVGPAMSRPATERLLEAVPVDRLVMIGIAGGLHPDIRIADLVVPEVVVDGDDGGTEYRPAPLAGLEPRGRLLTSGEFIVDPVRYERFLAEGIVALDMETAAVAAACEARGVPWSVVRAASDRADDGLVDSGLIDLARDDGRPDLKAVARLLARKPWAIKRLARLGRDASRASKASVDAALAALG